MFWEKPRWGGRDRGPALSTRPIGGAEGEAPALGRPREGEGVALGKPRDGEGKLGSDTASGSVDMLLMGSLEDTIITLIKRVIIEGPHGTASLCFTTAAEICPGSHVWY